MLDIRNISFSYQSQTVIDQISFSVGKGEHLAVIGESGCGKSTLLKLLYGLYDLDDGEILHNGDKILGPKFNLVPGMPLMKYLAQDFDLMPFITVAENIGKYLSNVNKEKKRQRVYDLLEQVEMTEYAQVKAKYLSGGQQQRVALARVLALEPEILLLDEPFSQIDAFRRNNLRRNLFGYLKEKNITCIFATHDSTDILAFADAVAVMKNGSVIKIGEPQVVYENPQTLYTASLFGEVSEIPAHLVTSETDLQKTILLYPHQLQSISESRFKVKVVASFFNRNGYLIEAVWDENRKVFFENPDALSPGLHVQIGLKTRLNSTR